MRTPPSGRGLTHGQRVRRIVANALVARGFVEVLTYPFVGDGVADAFGLKADDERRYAVRVANPLSDEAPLMRTSVLSTLVEAVRRNLSRGRKDIALFELGMVTLPGADATHTAPVPGVDRRPDDETIKAMYDAVPPQPRHVAAVMAGEAERTGWWGPGRAASWEDAVESALAVARAVAVAGGGRAGDRPRAVAPRPLRAHRPHRRHPASGTPVSCTPRRWPRSACPPRTVALELDVEELTRGQRADDAVPRDLHLPGRPDRRGARRRRHRDGRRGRALAAVRCR